MKKIEISIPDKDYDLLTRIAKSEKRRLSDMHYLLYSEGLHFFFCETSVMIKRLDSEFTEEEKKQIKINDKLEKIKGWYKLDDKVQEEKGYKFVPRWLSNNQWNKETDKYDDTLIKPLAERIESYVLEAPTDEEVTK
tara:strand:- start:378 stop:788 length:411 start_codon:yes stop_codon:yes gene_type:complete